MDCTAPSLKKPEMILFDYGQTLIAEETYNGLSGTEALMKYAVSNPHGYTAEDVNAEADRLNREIGRGDMKTRHLFQIEVPNRIFSAFLYGSMGIKLSLTADEIDRIFWDAASPGAPTDGIEDFLDFLARESIRTGVISNISYSGKVVSERINRMLPRSRFEFIIATSEYTFRKPNRHIFDLAAETAGTAPENIWYIGDSYECDVVGSKNAGMFPVYYSGASANARRACPDETVLSVDSWAALQSILESL